MGGHGIAIHLSITLLFENYDYLVYLMEDYCMSL